MEKEIKPEEHAVAKAIAIKLFRFLIDNFPRHDEEKTFPLKKLKNPKHTHALQNNGNVLSDVRGIFVTWGLSVCLRGENFFIKRIGP